MRCIPYNSNTLEQRINRDPLTADKIEGFIENKLGSYSFTPHNNASISTIGNGKYHIDVGTDDSRYKQAIKFLHEVAHGYYQAMCWHGDSVRENPNGSFTDVGKMEDMLTKAAKKFYNNAGRYTEKLLKNLKKLTVPVYAYR